VALTVAEKSARYRAKDVEAYRKRKREMAREPKHRKTRTKYMRKYRDKHRQPRKPRDRKFTDEQIKERKRIGAAKWRAAHREKCRLDSRAYYETHRKQAAISRSRHHLMQRYGITPEQKTAMFKKQGSRCAICGTKKQTSKSAFHVDHCHKGGEIRGILCHVCNTKLGWYERFYIEIKAYLR
jgi:hypothetical protein